MHYALHKLKNTAKGKGGSLDIVSNPTQKKSVMTFAFEVSEHQ